MDWSTIFGISPAMGASAAGPTFDDRFAPAAGLPPAVAPPPAYANAGPSLGASLSGGAGGPGGAPLDISTQGPGGMPGAARSGLLQALRGAQMPAAPEVQRVATPRPPERQAIPSGELIRLLTSMGITPNDLPKFRG